MNNSILYSQSKRYDEQCVNKIMYWFEGFIIVGYKSSIENIFQVIIFHFIYYIVIFS
jgi:hypothetical protein